VAAWGARVARQRCGYVSALLSSSQWWWAGRCARQQGEARPAQLAERAAQEKGAAPRGLGQPSPYAAAYSRALASAAACATAASIRSAMGPRGTVTVVFGAPL
jgi:hypothetical protein